MIAKYTLQHASTQRHGNLELWPRLRLLQYRVQLRRLHHIALNLQLSSHKQLLRIRLALHQLSKILVTQQERHGSFLALGCEPFTNGAGLLEINVP
jgi:hypothetical protein